MNEKLFMMVLIQEIVRLLFREDVYLLDIVISIAFINTTQENSCELTFTVPLGENCDEETISQEIIEHCKTALREKTKNRYDNIRAFDDAQGRKVYIAMTENQAIAIGGIPKGPLGYFYTLALGKHFFGDRFLPYKEEVSAQESAIAIEVIELLQNVETLVRMYPPYFDQILQLFITPYLVEDRGCFLSPLLQAPQSRNPLLKRWMRHKELLYKS